MPAKKESQIGVVRPNTDPTNETDWPAQHDWLREMLERLHQTFAQRAKSLSVPGAGAFTVAVENGVGQNDPANAEPEPV